MSVKSTDIKRLAFDSVLFSYSAALLIYAFAFLSEALRWSPISLTQEFFISNFQSLSWGAFGVWLFSLLMAFMASSLSIPTVGEVLFSSDARRETAEGKSFFKSFWGIHLSLTFLLTLIVSLQVTQASLYELLDPDGLAGAWRLWSGLSHPNLTLLPKAVIESIETIFIAFLATVIAIPIAFLLAFFCAKNIMIHPISFGFYALLRLFMNISRSIEPLIWALIFTVWVGVGPFAGMLALMIHSVASLAKYYSEILESVDDRPIDGVRSTGANSIQVIWYAIVPQVILPYIAMTIYRWDTNVRMATVIGLVGGGGIGTLLIQYQGQAMWPEVGCIILVIAVIVWLMDVASAYVREALK